MRAPMKATAPSFRNGFAAIAPKSCLTTQASCGLNFSRWYPRAIGAWGPTPHANGGLLKHDLSLPDMADHAMTVISPGGER
jgi:phosphoketolase